MLKISVFPTLMQLLLHAGDALSQLITFPSLLRHLSEQRADKLSFGLFNPVNIPADIRLVFAEAATPLRRGPYEACCIEPFKAVSSCPIKTQTFQSSLDDGLLQGVSASLHLEICLLHNSPRKDHNSPERPRLV